MKENDNMRGQVIVCPIPLDRNLGHNASVRLKSNLYHHAQFLLIKAIPGYLNWQISTQQCLWDVTIKSTSI